MHFLLLRNQVGLLAYLLRIWGCLCPWGLLQFLFIIIVIIEMALKTVVVLVTLASTDPSNLILGRWVHEVDMLLLLKLWWGEHLQVDLFLGAWGYLRKLLLWFTSSTNHATIDCRHLRQGLFFLTLKKHLEQLLLRKSVELLEICDQILHRGLLIVIVFIRLWFMSF